MGQAVSEQAPSRLHQAPVGVKDHIDNWLHESFYWPQYPEPQSCAAAFFATNEKLKPDIIPAVRSRNPDGYLTAVGIGMSLLLPKFFKPENPPLGVVLIDTQPEVTALANAFIQAHLQTNGFDEFNKKFYCDPIRLAPNFLQDDQPGLEVFHHLEQDRRTKYFLEKMVKASRKGFEEAAPEYYPDLGKEMRETYEMWNGLVRTGNVAVIQGSIIHPKIIAAVTSLPDYANHTNVVYASNVTDHFVIQDNPLSCQYGLDDYLQLLAKYSPSDHPAIFLDTLRGLNYWLRVSEGVPQMCLADIQTVEVPNFPPSVRLPDLNFNPTPQKPDIPDLSAVPEEELKNVADEMYRQLYAQFPDCSEVKNELEGLISAIGYSIYYMEYSSVPPRYYGRREPLEWVYFRFGPDIGKAVAICKELRKRRKEEEKW